MKEERHKLGAGIFIVLSSILLIFGIMWIRYFTLRPVMTIIAKFENPGPLSKGYYVYYRGVNIGKVDEIGFDKNFDNVYVYLKIYKKGIKIPSNVTAQVHTEGISGRKYIDLQLPSKGKSKTFLKDKEVINGEVAFGLDEIKNFVERQIRSGRLDEIIKNTDSTMKKMNDLSVVVNKIAVQVDSVLSQNRGNVEDLIKQSTEASKNINSITGGLSDVIGIHDGNKASVRQTLYKINSATDKITEAVSDKSLKDAISEFGNASTSVKNTFNDLNTIIKQPVDAQENENVISKTISNTNEAIESVKCLSNGISDILSQRFVLFKMAFGQPGKGLERCRNQRTIMEQKAAEKNIK